MVKRASVSGVSFRKAVPLCLSLLLWACADGPAQPETYGNLTARLQDFVSAYGLPGLAVGIVADGRVAYAQGFGYANAEMSTPITPATLFHAASISKTFVATGIMQLAEQGRLDIDHPLTDYIPGFAMADSRYRSITIRQMLTHTSGMADVEDYEWGAPQYDEAALGNYVLSLGSRSLIGNPGAAWAYSNLAFDCLGDVIAKVSGVSFEDYEAQNVLRRSGMTASTFLKPAGLPDGWASPHFALLTPRAWSGYPYNRIHAPSSTLHTSVNELLNWAITNLNHGTFEGARILQASTYGTLWGNHFPIPGGRGLFHNGGYQAIGWSAAQYAGETVIGHSGSDEGFVSNLILIPAGSAAIVILCNIYSPYMLQDLTGLLLDAVLGRPAAQLHPPAAVAAFRTLAESGVEAAVARWEALRSGSPDAYDFSSTYPWLVGENVLNRGTAQEAGLFAQLFKRIMPAATVAEAVTALQAVLQQDPGHENAGIMLGILSGAG